MGVYMCICVIFNYHVFVIKSTIRKRGLLFGQFFEHKVGSGKQKRFLPIFDKFVTCVAGRKN